MSDVDDGDIEPVERAIVDDVPLEEPDAPDLAQYVIDAVDRQDADDLRELAQYALERAAWADRDLEADDVDVDDDEELVDVKPASGGGTKVIKKIPCGKDNCSTCPHGPYEYRNYREGDKVRTEYIGPA